jgi:hypothetical protein
MKSYRDMTDDQRVALVELALFKQCLLGNTKAISVWLFNRSPDKWQPNRKQVELAPPNLEELIRQINSRLEGLPD